jgi:hypothetical protein
MEELYLNIYISMNKICYSRYITLQYTVAVCILLLIIYPCDKLLQKLTG